MKNSDNLRGDFFWLTLYIFFSGYRTVQSCNSEKGATCRRK